MLLLHALSKNQFQPQFRLILLDHITFYYQFNDQIVLPEQLQQQENS